ncbi:uncharacterized protein TNCV_4885031 [Trichonephila clavipes]|nr:uncharacterized protein TNCV_4885031 [Trichonephila clavipes]
MSSFLGFCEWNTRNRWRDGQGTMAPWARQLGGVLACYAPIGKRRRRRGDPKKKKRGGDPKGEVEEKSSEKTRAGRLRKRRGESQSVLFRDADQESKTWMRNNALRTGPRQAVELRKGDLLEVARELGVDINGDQTRVEIKDMILQNDKNDMETIKAVMEGILEEKEREVEERRQIREFELERMRIQLRNKLNENKLKAGNRINDLANVCILSENVPQKSNIGSEFTFEIDLPGKRDRSTIYRLNLIKLYRRKPELANLVMENSSERIDSETLYSVKLFMDFGFQGNLRKSQLYFKLPPDRSSYLRMINAKKKERFLPGPGTIVLRQKDINLVTGKPFRIKTCCSSQMLINSLREDTEYLLDLGVNGMGQSNRTLPVVWLGRVNRYPYPRIKCIKRRGDPKKKKRGGDPKGEVEEKSSEKTRAGRLRKRRGESQSVLFRDADQESKTRMRNNALRTGPRQAVE